MPLIPISFVITVLLCLSIYQFIGDGKAKSHVVFLLLFIVEAAQSVLLGLTWGYGVHGALVIQSIVATMIPPLIWLSYQSLSRPITLPDFLRHSSAALIMVLIHVFGFNALIDAVTMGTAFGYGAALLLTARKGEDVLTLVRHDSVDRCLYLFRFTGWALIASVVLDALIFVDFIMTGGQTAGVFVSVGNAFFLLVLWMAAFLIHEGKTADTVTGEASIESLEPSSIHFSVGDAKDDRIDEELAVIAQHINTLMQQALFKDLELNTTKIARKVGVPARKVSQAINRVYGKSVSQFVNQFRVEEACRLLLETQDSVTQVALNAGFMTKSNFHREFSRITQSTPTQWRRANATCATHKTHTDQK